MRIPALAAVLLCGSAFADTALQSGVGAAVTLIGTTPSPNLYIDVDASARQLNVSVSAAAGDVDLFLRYGSPFPTQDTTVAYPTVDWEALDRYGQYHSISSAANESIRVLPSSRVPLRAGRWYIAVIDSSSATVATTVTATVSSSLPVGEIALDFLHPRTSSGSDHSNDCDDSFWTDATPATPVGGNNGTTLGQQRKNALIYATQQLVQQLQIPITVNAHACGAHLAGDSNSAILAHAGPAGYFIDEPKFPIGALPKKYTWYPAAAIGRLNGTSLCGFAGGPCDDETNAELEITFNEDIGKSTVIGGETFYLGFDPDSPGAQSLDFVTIAMHEMTHGLGFFGLANMDSSQGPLGAKAGIDTQQNTIAYENVDEGPYDDIYDDSIAEVSGSVYTPFMGYEVNGSGDAARAAALVSGPIFMGTYSPGTYTGLRWSDSAAANSPVNIHHGETTPNNFPSLYAPCDKSKTTTCATQPASTLSHTVQSGDMMNAYYSRFNLRNMGLAVPMLGPVGWSNATATPPAVAQPVPSAWYDRTHTGHGFDFQLAYHDPVGDVYVLTLYTYSASGAPEWYEAYGHVIDGVFTPTLQQNGGTLYRIHYAASTPGNLDPQADPAFSGSVVVDFNQAANSPACRNADRSAIADQLAVMTWTIGTESGTWCVEPLVGISEHASPDYNGLWYAPADSGWGFELLDVATGDSSPFINLLMYLPGTGNQPTWAIATGNLTNGSATLPLQQISNGFCRSCPPPPDQTTTTIGSITLTLDPIAAGQQPGGTASFTATYPTGGTFSRSNIPIQMFSVPTGH